MGEVNYDQLNRKIEESGMTLVAIAEKSDIPYQKLRRRINKDDEHRGEFTVNEIIGLSRALRLTVSERRQIFLI